MVIEQATKKHVNIISELIARLLSELDGKQYSRFDFIKTTDSLMNDSVTPYTVFLAKDEFKYIGLISIVECRAIYAQGKYGVIQELYIDSEYRSSGVGKSLLDCGASYGRKRHWTRLEVTAPNATKWKRTLQFYKKHDFVQIGPRLKRIL